MVITEDFFLYYFLNSLHFEFFYMDLQCPLIGDCCTGCGRMRNDCYSTMSDGILGRIFPHSSQNLSVDLF